MGGAEAERLRGGSGRNEAPVIARSRFGLNRELAPNDTDDDEDAVLVSRTGISKRTGGGNAVRTAPEDDDGVGDADADFDANAEFGRGIMVDSEEEDDDEEAEE